MMSVMSREDSVRLGAALKQLKANRPRIPYAEYVERANERPLRAPYLINIRGTSGTGKSTVPIQMVLSDREAVYVTDTDGAEILTYSPKHHTTMLGRYQTKTGGLDSEPYQGTKGLQRTDDVLARVWRDTHTHILMEGLFCSGIYEHYANLFRSLEDTPNHRRILLMHLVGDMDMLEQRILKRSGRKRVRMQHVEAKQNATLRHLPKFQEAGFLAWVTTTQGVAFDDMLDWYHNEIVDALVGDHRGPSPEALLEKLIYKQ